MVEVKKPGQTGSPGMSGLGMIQNIVGLFGGKGGGDTGGGLAGAGMGMLGNSPGQNKTWSGGYVPASGSRDLDLTGSAPRFQVYSMNNSRRGIA